MEIKVFFVPRTCLVKWGPFQSWLYNFLKCNIFLLRLFSLWSLWYNTVLDTSKNALPDKVSLKNQIVNVCK